MHLSLCQPLLCSKLSSWLKKVNGKTRKDTNKRNSRKRIQNTELSKITISAPSTCLNVFLELQEWCVHDVPQAEVLTVHFKGSADDLCNALPVAGLHCLVGHELKQWTHVIEVIYCLLERVESWPLFQPLGKLTTPGHKQKKPLVTSSDPSYVHVFVFCMNEETKIKISPTHVSYFFRYLLLILFAA